MEHTSIIIIIIAAMSHRVKHMLKQQPVNLMQLTSSTRLGIITIAPNTCNVRWSETMTLPLAGTYRWFRNDCIIHWNWRRQGNALVILSKRCDAYIVRIAYKYSTSSIFYLLSDSKSPINRQTVDGSKRRRSCNWH